MSLSSYQGVFRPLGHPSFKFKGSMVEIVPKIGHKIKQGRCSPMLSEGLAHVVETWRIEVTIDSVLVVREFADILLEDLSNVPPKRDVEFEIVLELRTTPISRMTSAELEELKLHIQELLDKGFIRSSVYPWEP